MLISFEVHQAGKAPKSMDRVVSKENGGRTEDDTRGRFIDNNTVNIFSSKAGQCSICSGFETYNKALTTVPDTGRLGVGKKPVTVYC